MRSALDYLACWIVTSTGGTVTGRTKFPICDTAECYNASPARQIIECAGKHFIKLLDGVKPYKGGNDWSWRLRKLNNIDKHRLLLTVAPRNPFYTETLTAAQKFRKDWAREHPGEALPFPDNMVRHVRSGTPLEILKAGSILRTISDTEVDIDPEFTIEISFNEPGIIEGEAISLSLHQMLDATKRVLSAFGVMA